MLKYCKDQICPEAINLQHLNSEKGWYFEITIMYVDHELGI